MAADDRRKIDLDRWAREQLGKRGLSGSYTLEAASDDASFRRYFRAGGVANGSTFIFVDAPPGYEDSRPFIKIAKVIGEAGLNAPVVIEHDIEQGFMMLSDFGEILYLNRLQHGNRQEIERLYQQAFDALQKMQQIKFDLPLYDEKLLRMEMGLFPEWFLDQQLGLKNYDGDLLERAFELMVDNALGQPRVFVHRDYHSRNLMVTASGNPGIIDFQDAVRGPVTYDLVSLLKDCYHRFGTAQRQVWVEQYRQRLEAAGLLDDISPTVFLRWFDLMGFQRHLKCAGIFSRLHLRDGKLRYLGDIPLVLDYMLDVCGRYQELNLFGDWLSQEIMPRLTAGDSSS